MSWLHAVLDVPVDLVPRAAAFWAAATGWPLGAAWPGHPELRSFEPPGADAYLHLQTVSGPPRVHLDLEVEDLAGTRDRLATAGAAVLAAQDQWQTMRSPGGLPFCLVPARPRRAPEPLAWADGHRSRLVQVCIDCPRATVDAELGFWHAALSPGRWSRSPSAEFAGKFHDDQGSPAQLLFQCLDEEQGPVRAHLDLGTDDLAAESARLVRLGAERLAPGRGWVALRDPVGLAFCATENSPELLTHRNLG